MTARNGALEAPEDPRLIDLRDPDPLVGDDEAHALTDVFHRHAHRFARAEDERVACEVGHHLLDPKAIALHTRPGRADDDDIALLARRRAGEEIRHFVREADEIDRLDAKREVARSDPRRDEEIVDQAREARHVALASLETLRDVRALLVRDRASQLRREAIDRELERGERGIELVRCDGDELVARRHARFGGDAARVREGPLGSFGLEERPGVFERTSIVVRPGKKIECNSTGSKSETMTPRPMLKAEYASCARRDRRHAPAAMTTMYAPIAHGIAPGFLCTK